MFGKFTSPVWLIKSYTFCFGKSYWSSDDYSRLIALQTSCRYPMHTKHPICSEHLAWVTQSTPVYVTTCYKDWTVSYRPICCSGTFNIQYMLLWEHHQSNVKSPINQYVALRMLTFNMLLWDFFHTNMLLWDF